MQIPPTLTTLPNLLTLGRIAAIPLICLLIVSGWPPFQWLALLLYIAAAVSDGKSGRIPNWLVFGGALYAVLYHGFFPSYPGSSGTLVALGGRNGDVRI